MKKIYESPLNGWNESAERIHIYAMESDDEYWDCSNMNFSELCRYFDVFDESGCDVLPGVMYHVYSFDVTSNHVVMTETVAYNV